MLEQVRLFLPSRFGSIKFTDTATNHPTEYPSLRIFTLLPGIVPTDLMEPEFAIFAQDEAEQTGALALYLASPRADYLRNSLTSINWDLPTMEAHKEEIENGLLKVKWVSVLPCAGGTGI